MLLYIMHPVRNIGFQPAEESIVIHGKVDAFDASGSERMVISLSKQAYF